MLTAKEQEIIQLAHWFNNPWHVALLAIIAVWTIVWKGTALWKAGKSGSMPWFIVLLLVNTMGILEILYILFFSKKKNQQ